MLQHAAGTVESEHGTKPSSVFLLLYTSSLFLCRRRKDCVILFLFLITLSNVCRPNFTMLGSLNLSSICLDPPETSAADIVTLYLDVEYHGPVVTIHLLSSGYCGLDSLSRDNSAGWGFAWYSYPFSFTSFAVILIFGALRSASYTVSTYIWIPCKFLWRWVDRKTTPLKPLPSPDFKTMRFLALGCDKGRVCSSKPKNMQ